jgi:starvation-inducible DNA-binding protein
LGRAKQTWRHNQKGGIFTGKEETMKESAVIHDSRGSLALNKEAVSRISEALRKLLADVFSLYIKTKNFHWHMTGKHFRDYHLLLDEHAEQIFAMSDDVAERARKIGGTTLRSIGDVSRHQRLRDNDDQTLSAQEMLLELRDDNARFTGFLREAHEICAKYGDVATTSMIEVWIDQTERRTWFLTEIVNDH